MSDNTNILLRGLAIFAIVGFIIAFVVGYKNSQKEEQERTYNNGICTECGGDYVFVSAAKSSHYTYYYYQCNNCGKIIELRK